MWEIDSRETKRAPIYKDVFNYIHIKEVIFLYNYVQGVHRSPLSVEVVLS